SLSSFSNYGLTTVDIAAPGSSIYSTTPGNQYSTYSGTSMATPHVSGALALLRSMAPGLDHLQLKQHLLTNVDLIPAMASKCTSGGRLNVAKAAVLLAGPRIVPTTARVSITTGNGDLYLNPGEQGEFVFVFRNIGAENAIGLTATLGGNTSYPGITLTNPILTVGNLAASASSAEFRIPFSVSAAVATPTLAEFTLAMTDASANAWSSQQKLNVHTSSTVTGRVTSIASNLPVTTALVTWTGPVSGSMNVDAAGRFSFVAINGTYSVSASAPGFVSVSQISVTTPPSPAPLDLRLGVPDLTVSPFFVQQSVFSGTTTTTTLTLRNQGTAPLTWTAISTVGSSSDSRPADQQPTDTSSLAGKSIGNLGSTQSILPDFTSRGATIVPITLPLATDELDGIDVLIVEDSIVSATPADIALIRAWVSQGGGLFLTADNSDSMGNVNSLLLSSGIQETSLNTFVSGTINTILPHPATVDVTSLSLSSYGSSCTLTSPALPLMQDPSGRTLGGATTLDSGRIIAFGNELDSSISTTGGRLFANQAVDWLSKTVRWLSVADGSGVLAPGQSHDLVVRFDSARLNAGALTGEIIILSNEPGSPRTLVPVSLTVIGSPAIAADPASLAFPTTFVAGTSPLNLRLENPGSDTLTVSSLTFSNSAYSTASAAPFSILPGANVDIPIRFSPRATGTHPATLTIANNSPGSPALTVSLSGSGADGPELTLDPDSFNLTLPLGSRLVQPLTIANTGDYRLDWSLDLAAAQTAASGRDTLEDLLTELDANFANITSLIPNRYDFTEGVTGSSISDGGNDMYDGGNYLTTNLSTTSINYSDGKITANIASLGPTGRYFTRKHPGLFVFAAEIDGVSAFNISGNLGADGSGSATVAVLLHSTGGKAYTGYVKRVHGTSKPSVNHLVIVEDRPGTSRTFSTDTNNDAHSVSGLSGSRQLYHLVFASAGGGLVDDTTCSAIMQAFLKNVTPSLPWLGFDDFEGSVAPASQQISNLIFDATAVDPGQYAATVELTTNDPFKPKVAVPVSLTVTSAPVIKVLPNPVAFADVPINTASQQLVEISNIGDLPLILSAATVAGAPGFSVAPLATPVLAPGASTVLQVLFSPTTTGTHSGTLNFTSNSPISPVLAIPLNGTATAAGILQALPASLALTLESGQTGALPLTLRNSGSQAVSWTSSASATKAIPDLSGLSVALVSSSASNVTSVQACLTSLGATTQFLDYYSFTQASLELFDVAVFDSNIDYVNSTQITAISSWLAGGGALLVHSSGSSYSNQNKLFTPFGISLSYQYHTGAWTPVGTHYLTKGITSVSPSYSSSRITPSGPAVPLLRETGG
ncbi:MAG: choice-of-anchor D domain-containing protein, partial [Luteolibacter sp.]